MILIAGGTGTLGTEVVHLLTARGLEVRILTRDPDRAEHERGDLVEVASGDVRDERAVERAVAGARTVISAVQGFAGTDPAGPEAVDHQGNSNLIRAAKKEGATEHFVLVSIHGAAPDHPMDLHRSKYLAEQELKASGLSWTIVRPTAYMETWAPLIGEPLLKRGRTRIFGRGGNPINFVSTHDVARFVELAVVDPSMRGETVEVGGPENLTMEQFARTFEAVSGKAGKVSHVPLPMMRLMSVLMRPVRPVLAGQVHAGVVMDTHDSSFDPSETLRRYPSIQPTSLSEVVRRDYVAPLTE
jgi:uncharacterized protein YbjT (DUF2867 family)